MNRALINYSDHIQQKMDKISNVDGNIPQIIEILDQRCHFEVVAS